MPKFGDDPSYFSGGIAPRATLAPATLTPEERLRKRQTLERQEEEEGEGSFLTHNPLTRGVAGALEGILEIPRIFGADYDIPDNFGLGHSTSTLGSLVEGSIQFLSGFIPGTFGLGHLGKVGKATKTAKALTSARKAKAAQAVAAGDRSYNAAKFARVRAEEILMASGHTSRQAGKMVRRYGFGRSMAVGAIADASVFTHDEQRLSNLLQHFGADNPVVNFLAADPDDEAAVGRFKNMLEGAGLGLAVEGLVVAVRGIFRRKKIIDDPKLSTDEKINQIAKDLEETAEAAEDALGGARAADEAEMPRTDEGKPAEADVDGDLAQMSWRELQQEAKNHKGVKRGGRGVNVQSLRRDITDARKAATKQTQESKAFDEQQFPNRGATETAEEAAERQAQGGPVPTKLRDVPHKSDETQLEIQGQETNMGDQFGPDWSQVTKRTKTWTEVDPATGQKKKRQKTVWEYKDDPTRPVDPALINAINRRDRLTNRMLGERRAEMLIGDRPPNASWKELAHHAGLRTFAQTIVRNKEISKNKVLEIIGALDDQLAKGEFTPEKIPGVMNTAMLGPESFGQLVKIMTDHGVVKPAHLADANGKNLGFRTIREKVTNPKTGETHMRERTVDRDGNSVKDSELKRIRIRVLANQTGQSPAQIAARLNKHSKRFEDSSVDAQAMSSVISAHLGHARELYHAMSPENKALRRKLGLGDDPETAVRAFARWMQEATPMIESWGRYRRSVSRSLYMMRYGADEILPPGVLRDMMDELGGSAHIQDIGDKLFGRGGALESGGVTGATAALRSIDRNKRWWMMINEHFVNFVLSGLRTFSTNTLGNAVTAVYGPLETMLAARAKKGYLTITGRRSAEVEAEVLRSTQELMGLWSQIGDSYLMMKKTWKTGEYQLDRGGKGTLDVPDHQQNAWTSENWAALRGQEHDPSQFVGQRFMDIWGPILRIPSKGLMATDEFFKQLNYRTTVRADLVVEARSLMSAGKLRDHRKAVDPDFVGPQLQTMDEFIEEEMRAMTVRGQALVKDNLIREADKRFTLNMKDEKGDLKFKFADGHIALAAAKRQWIDKQLRGGVASRGAIAQRAVDVARERTFTTQLDPEKGFLSDMGKTLSQFGIRHPSIRLFVPFIRTPLNIFVYASRRTAIPVLNKDILGAAEYLRVYKLQGKSLEGMKSQMARELASPDARVRNEAHGRMMASVGWLFGITAAAQSGVLTGAGPADKDMRKVMTNAGWQPYSLKVGDTYISYQKLDPLATVLGLYADMADASKWATEEDQSYVERLSVSAAISIAHNMKSKSYLQGMTNAAGIINDPEISIPAVGGRMLGAFLVPSFVAGFRELTDDSYVEMRGVLDGLTSRIPGWSSVSLDPMRNAIGEKVDRRHFQGAAEAFHDINALFLPTITNRTTSDLITQEFAELEYPFSTPSRFKFGMDLTDVQNEKGQTAYDRWLELSSTMKIGRRTLRQRLERLINSRAYQAIPKEGIAAVDVDSPQIIELMKVIRAYRGYALQEMIKEFPDVGNSARSQTIARSAIKRNVDPALIRAQLFPVE
jgi:hypothetical protein